jgi:DhnA family fructose-bisphosphate aldolase class Ia
MTQTSDRDARGAQLACGKTIRMGRIMGADGRVVIAALDHGVTGISNLGALARPAELLAIVAASGADCVLVTPGSARRFAAAIGRLGMIVRIDAGPTSATGRWNNIRSVLSVQDALRLGADGVAVMGLIGTEAEERSLGQMATIAADCDRLGMPLLAEMLPGGLTAESVTVDQLAVAAHVAAELGADIVKIRYQGPASEFSTVTGNCFRPVVVLGGPQQADGDLLGSLREAMQAGAAGVAVGRNVWGAAKPGDVVGDLRNLVHGFAG